jgi:threonine dehydrogenase-like Zn-dependent dehydrogenase
MIVIGLDVHKHSLTAVAVDELGRERGAWSGPIGLSAVQWAQSLEAERLWAVEDCRHVTRALEQTLLAAGERLVRVPPRLTAPQRRRGRARGKSDRIDALAVARAALQEPQLDGPRAGDGCAGTCTSSTQTCASRSARSTAPSGSTGSHANLRGASKQHRRGSRATCSSVAGHSPARSPTSTAT